MSTVQEAASTSALERAPAFCILIVDDDADWLRITPDVLREAFKDFVASLRLDIQVAASVAEADGAIARTDFDAVLCDVTLDSALRRGVPEFQGDEWLLSRTSSLPEECFKAVVTGFPQRIRSLADLQRAEILVVRKSTREDEEDLFEQILKRARSKLHGSSAAPPAPAGPAHEPAAGGREFEAEQSPTDTTRSAIGEKLLLETGSLFAEWLRTRSDPTAQAVQVGRQLFSLDDLAREVSTGSPIGVRLLRMFVSEIRARIGLHGEPGRG